MMFSVRHWLEVWGLVGPNRRAEETGWPHSPDTRAHHDRLRADLAGWRSPHTYYTPAQDCRYVVLDLETTGLNPRVDRVISVGAVLIAGDRMVTGAAFDELVNPGRPVPPLITDLTGITTAAVAEAAGLSEVLHRFLQFAGPAVIVGHNIDFDLAFLNRHLERHCGRRLPHPAVNTVWLCRTDLRSTGDCSLDAMARRHGVPIRNRHTALGDALITAQVFVSELARMRRLGPVLLGDLQRRPFVPSL